MLRTLAFLSLLVPTVAFAQNATDNSTTMPNGMMNNDMMSNGTMPNGMMPNGMMANGMMANGMMANGMMANGMMDHSKMHGQMGGTSPTEPGQAAFATIQEIVVLLESDPKTDWSKVNIDALREHLVDMDAVTLNAKVLAQPVDGGMTFTVTGEGSVTDSIRRMLMAHSATMNGTDGWKYTAAEAPGGATLTVIVPAQDQEKLRGLGFFGILTVGMHHQEHHLMMARGEHAHN
jgi:hypothetical protein